MMQSIKVRLAEIAMVVITLAWAVLAYCWISGIIE
jgi:hypothetical protein